MSKLRWGMWCLVAVVMAAMSGGCQDPLFPADAPRSPYERYQALRGDERPMVDEMSRGTARSGRPALRQRLRPLDQY